MNPSGLHKGIRSSLRRFLLLLCFAAVLTARADELSDAAQQGDTTAVARILTQEGGAKGDRGFYALLNASRTGQLGVMEMMLKDGANPNRLDTKQKQLPLLLAIGAKQSEAVALLLRYGADPNLSGKCQENRCTGHPALIPAVVWHQHEIVKMLLAKGADVHWNDDLPTQQANMDNDAAMFQLLVSAGGRPWSVHPYTKERGRTGPSEATSKNTGTREEIAGIDIAKLLPGNASPQSTVAPAHERCRFAIIADQANQSAADLLTVALQKHPNIEVIERNELDKILAEQKLTSAFSPDRETAGKLGQLLKADALLLLRNQTIAKVSVLEARLIRVSAGLVLSSTYRPLPLDSIEKWAAETARDIAARAAQTISRDNVAVSLLNVRSSLATPLGRQLENTLTALLAQRLSKEPGMILLERSDMERLTAETSAGANTFWTGRFLAGGTVEPALDSSGSFSLTLQLTPFQGTAPIAASVTGLKGAPGKAIDAALAILREKLNRASPPSTNPLEEAQRYLEEARWADRCGLFKQARAAAEVAWSLGLQTPESAKLRLLGASRMLQAEYAAIQNRIGENEPLWFRRDLLNHPLRQPDAIAAGDFITLGQRVVELWSEPVVNGLMKDPATLAEWFGTLEEMVKGAALPLAAIDTVQESIRYQEKLQALRETLRDTLKLAMDRAGTLPAETKALNQVAKLHVQIAALLHQKSEDLLQSWQQLCQLTFPSENFSTRAEIRHSIRHSSGAAVVRVSSPAGTRQSSPYPAPWSTIALPKMMEALRASKAPEDQLTVLSWDYFNASRGSEKQVQIGRSLYELTSSLAPELAKNPELMDRQLLELESLIHLPIRPVPNSTFTSRMTDDAGGYNRLSPEVYALRRKILVALLAANAPPTLKFFGWLDEKQYTPAEAAEVRTAIRAWLPRIKNARRAGGMWMDYKFAEFAAANDPQPFIVDDSARTLKVTRAWHAFQHGVQIQEDEGETFEIASSSFCWAQDSIWFYGFTSPTPWLNLRRIRRHIFRVNPETFETERIDLPEFGDDLITQPVGGKTWKKEGVFLITPEYLFFAAADRFLAVYTRATKQWQLIPDIIPTGGRPAVEGKLLIIPVRYEQSSAVVTLDIPSWKSNVLISGRRQPVASPLDGPGFGMFTVVSPGKEEVEVYARTKGAPGEIFRIVGYTWNPTTDTWRQIADSEVQPKAGNLATFYPGFTHAHRISERGATPNPNSRLTMQLSKDAKEDQEIPVRFDTGNESISLPKGPSAFRELNNMYRGLWLGCKAGIVFPHNAGGPGFWFLPRRDFETFLAKQGLSPLDLTRAE